MWQPIIDGPLRGRALEAAASIADALRDNDVPTGRRNRSARSAAGSTKDKTEFAGDASLSRGSAGLAVMFAYFAQAGLGAANAADSQHYLRRAMTQVASQPMGAPLYAGLAGVGWALAHLRRMGQGTADTAPIDEVLLDYLDRARWDGHYDLISGLVGFGVYALEQWPSPFARECLVRVVSHLSTNAERSRNGTTWFTAPGLLPGPAGDASVGHYNLGLAHGVPGVIAFLGMVCALDCDHPSAGPPRSKGTQSPPSKSAPAATTRTQAKALAEAQARARILLEGAVTWLLAQRLPRGSASVFAHRLSLGEPPSPTRLAWCYGDLGIAVALLGAARSVNSEKWEQQALRIARQAAARSSGNSGIKDAGLCHGSAGVAHLFNRLYQATGESRFADSSRRWVLYTLEHRNPKEAIAGFPGNHMGKWVALPGILEGAAGVALSLISAATPQMPEWDRMLMIAIPNGTNPSTKTSPASI